MDTLTDDEVKARVNELLEKANADPEYKFRCSYCRKPVVWVEHVRAVAEGHIYSDAGMREWHITRMCEFCFDEITKEPDEDD